MRYTASMFILGIETSCDETAVAVLETTGETHTDTPRVVAHAVYSQIETHTEYGGVVPRLAKFEHQKNLPVMVKAVLKEANASRQSSKSQNDLEESKIKIDLVAVTVGPGLAPALAVGKDFGVEFAKKNNIPIIGVNHIEGHIYSAWLDQTPSAFPLIALIVSGGHTQLALMHDFGEYDMLGSTVDDAAGESFDKVGKMLNLEYPGGPVVSKRAELGDSEAYDFPRPMLTSGDYNFSFAGLKTAVLYALKGDHAGRMANAAATYSDEITNNVCASFQKAVIDVLVAKTKRAVKEHKPTGVLLVGGVAANERLGETLKKELPVPVMIPDKKWTGDNAVMIALAGYHRYLDGMRSDPDTLDIHARWPITEII